MMTVKRRISLMLILLIIGVFVLTCFTGCTPATEQAVLTFTDAGGAGVMTTTVLILLSDATNTPYIKDVKKVAEELDKQVDALTQTKDVYKVDYTGTVGDRESISMSFSFTDINDYNRKCLRLYNSASDSLRNNLKRTDRYPMATWAVTDKGNGSYEAAFSQDGAVFSMVNLWAYEWLMSHDVEGGWDYTGDGNNVQFNPLGDNTFIDSKQTRVVVKIGDSSETFSAFKGAASQTVSLTGQVTGTPVTAETSVSDKDLIVSEKVKETVPSYPALTGEAAAKFESLCNIDLKNLPTDRKIKVACVGDSITQGSDDWQYPSYPWYLQSILGDGYDVQNFGVSGTRLTSSDGNGAAYIKSAKYQPSLDFNPDVVIIMLGTNDSSAYTFKRFDRCFAKDYQALVDAYKNLPSHPYVIVATTPYEPATSGTSAINEYIIPYERELFTKLNGVDGVVDIAAWSNDRYYLYFDNVHYSAEGYYSLAHHYASRIFGVENGHRTVTVKAVPGAIVTLKRETSDGHIYQQNVVADKDGVAVLREIDGTYTLTVRATDYARYQTAVTVNGDCTVDCAMNPGDYNVALYRPVTGSTVDNSSHTAEMVNDEEWGSNWHPLDGDSVGGSLVFDLGNTKELHGLRLLCRFQSYPSSYKVEVSDDGVNYREAATLRDARDKFVNDHLEEHYFDSVSGRYVKVTFLAKGYMFNYEIYDLQLLSNDKRTVSEREKEIIAQREEANKQNDPSSGGEKKTPLWPYVTGGAALLAAAAATVVFAVKKK